MSRAVPGRNGIARLRQPRAAWHLRFGVDGVRDERVALAVQGQIGAGQPLVLVGYSNGGALLTKYALDAVEDASLPQPSKLILLSPMIGVSPAARFASSISLLGPVIPKARWIDVVPEYNPFKYNSFPANAGAQTFRFTRALNSQMLAAAASGSLQRMPPVLAFQSVVDTTVSSPAVVRDLFDHLPPGRSELVVFDLNRQAGVELFTRPEEVLPRLIGDEPRHYAVTLVTNTRPDTLEVSAMSVPAGAVTISSAPLGLSLSTICCRLTRNARSLASARRECASTGPLGSHRTVT